MTANRKIAGLLEMKMEAYARACADSVGRGRELFEREAALLREAAKRIVVRGLEVPGI